MFGLLKIGAGLLSGALNRRAERKAQREARESRLTMKQQVDEALEAGLNPSSVLGAGGMAIQPAAPVLSSKSFIGEAIKDGFQLWEDHKREERAEEFDNLKRDIMRAELDHLKSGRNPHQDFGFQIPQVRTQTRQTTDMRPALGSPGQLETTPGTVTNPVHVNSGIFVNPRQPDAEMMETRYGDIAQEVGGGVNLLTDTLYNTRLQTIRTKVSPEAAQRVHETFTDPDAGSLTQVIRKTLSPEELQQYNGNAARPQPHLRRQSNQPKAKPRTINKPAGSSSRQRAR